MKDLLPNKVCIKVRETLVEGWGFSFHLSRCEPRTSARVLCFANIKGTERDLLAEPLPGDLGLKRSPTPESMGGKQRFTIDHRLLESPPSVSLMSRMSLKQLACVLFASASLLWPPGALPNLHLRYRA